MAAFAANSLFARWALTGIDSDPAIDPAGYTAIRMTSGAVMLWLLVAARGGDVSAWASGTWASALALFAYAAFFSFAYITLDTGMGALILFACVQATMIGWGLFKGERPTALAWLGMALALAGLAYLLSPGLSAPDPFGAALMVVSGVAWGVYSLRGRGAADPLAATAGNFIYAAPIALVLCVIMVSRLDISFQGLVLAFVSGAVTSGVGYALWYNVLRHITASNAAVVQLTVPVIATGFGIVVLGEDLTLRIALASLAILGGVAISLVSKPKDS